MKKNKETDLTFQQFTVANRFRCLQSFHSIYDWSPSDWGTALAGETGEACNLIKKLRRLDWPPGKSGHARAMRDRERLITAIGKELADVVIYADLLAARLGLNLGHETRKKFNAVSRRVGSKVKL